ncbi:MAG: ABC transporter substrate-binding protein [Dehalococcoidia bacterium]|nr:ABC transporter substrate-binding protein [Dehalococcoidia bacterium]
MAGSEFWERFNGGTMDRRTFVKAASLLGGAAVFGLPLLGCQPAAPKQTFEMKMAVPAAMIQANGLYSGDARNMFWDEGVVNALTEFSGGADQARAILTGSYPLGVTSTPAGIAAWSSGEPARFIAAGYNALGIGFMVKPDSPFKKPEDLKGKKFKLGYSRPNSNSHIACVQWLKGLGIDPNDKNQVELVATGGIPDTWTATRGGVVDVGWSAEPTVSQLESTGEGRTLFMWWDPDFVAVSIMTTQGFIDTHGSDLKKWTTAYAKAVDWVKNNYSEAAKDLAQVLGIEVPVAEAALKKTPKEVFTAAMPKKQMDHTASVSVEFKLIDKMPDWKVLINQSFLPDNLKDSTY